MTYPASPADPASGRVRPDSAQFWAGGVATAVVAALIALVGILVCRWALKVPILAPAGDGAWGNAHTGVYALLAALVALVAAGVLYLLLLSTPRPLLFFQWITGLATVLAVVYPLSTSAPLDQKAATAIVDLVIGLAIISLLSAVAARSVRVRRVVRRYADDQAPGSVQVINQPAQPAGPERGYQAEPGYAPPQPSYQPTQPLNEPEDGPRRYR
jgi:Family of unknown function (DUF6069)